MHGGGIRSVRRNVAVIDQRKAEGDSHLRKFHRKFRHIFLDIGNRAGHRAGGVDDKDQVHLRSLRRVGEQGGLDGHLIQNLVQVLVARVHIVLRELVERGAVFGVQLFGHQTGHTLPPLLRRLKPVALFCGRELFGRRSGEGRHQRGGHLLADLQGHVLIGARVRTGAVSGGQCRHGQQGYDHAKSQYDADESAAFWMCVHNLYSPLMK